MSSASPKVLIVDDDADTRELFGLLFEEGGFTVCAASTAAEALENLRSAAPPPDVILSDIVMPGASGVEFIRQLSRDAALKQIPVIAVTGGRLVDVPIEARVALQKPADPYALVQLAKDVLSTKGAPSPWSGTVVEVPRR